MIATSFSQYWKPWTIVTLRMPPPTITISTVSATSSPPSHTGLPRTVCSARPAPCSCGSDIEPPDHDHQDAGRQPHPGRAQPGLAEVGQRVGAGAAQRSRDQGQQQHVAHGVAHREPDGIGTTDHDQPGDAEERGCRQVLPGDGRGVPPRRHRAGSHVEVAGGARDPRAEAGQCDRGHDRGGHARDDRGAAHRPSTRSVNWLLVVLRVPDVPPARRQDRRVHQEAQEQPPQWQRTDLQSRAPRARARRAAAASPGARPPARPSTAPAAAACGSARARRRRPPGSGRRCPRPLSAGCAGARRAAVP